MTDWTKMDGKALLTALQSYAVAEGISDIHSSPEKEGVRFEVRLHGMLLPVASISHQTYVDFVRQVKFSSKLKMNITDVPQDGQYTFPAMRGTEQWTVNVRVATIPARFGEALTLRLLDPKRGIVPLKELGFPEDLETELTTMMSTANGIVLVTGPTGSGKTTTLYALLQTVIGRQRNIITLEDPIEYEIGGIVQSEIDPNRGYSFASGLRSILRHDPNIILVGEIRDLETAQTAIDASLTGHLVLSTLHTNSAIEAIPRLLSMGVSPYTFAPALRGILAQRLVRTLSPQCQKEGAQCNPAENSSYAGRRVIAEFLKGTPSIQQLILANEPTAAIEAQARKEGYRSMRERGEELVKEHITTDAEVRRVTV